jgi:hypothetical protein
MASARGIHTNGSPQGFIWQACYEGYLEEQSQLKPKWKEVCVPTYS